MASLLWDYRKNFFDVAIFSVRGQRFRHFNFNIVDRLTVPLHEVLDHLGVAVKGRGLSVGVLGEEVFRKFGRRGICTERIHETRKNISGVTQVLGIMGFPGNFSSYYVHIYRKYTTCKLGGGVRKVALLR